MDLPQLNTTEEGALEVIQPTTSKDTYHKPRELRSEAGGRESRKRKLNMPSSLTPSTGQEPAIELSVGR